LEICERVSVALDIDLPEDLELAGYELMEAQKVNPPHGFKMGK
jgi:hypothetical protein